MPFRSRSKRQVAKGHRNDRVDRIRIAAAHHVAQVLVDDIDRDALIVLAGTFEHFCRDHVTDATQLGMSERIRLADP